MQIESYIEPYYTLFWEKVDKTGDCWEWKGRITSRGYGRYAIKKTAFYAHRFALVSLGHKIPKDKVVDHICRNRKCVNPDHLRLVSLAQNTLENSVSTSAQNKTKTHCPKGHAYAGKNLLKTKSGRKCRQCTRKRQNKRYAEKKKVEGKDVNEFFDNLLK